MSKVDQEVPVQRVEAIRLVHQKTVAGVFENFQARTADALLHTLTEADEGARNRYLAEASLENRGTRYTSAQVRRQFGLDD